MSERLPGGPPLPLNLPMAHRGHLPRSPLQLVACQIKYAEPGRPLSASLSAAIVRALEGRGHHYPRVEPIQIASVELNMSAAGLHSTSGSPASAFRLLSNDGRWSVTLTPDSISLETQRYGRWEGDFRERFLLTLEIVAEHLAPAVCSRIGLRYVDVIATGARRPDELVGTIRDEFLGPVLDPAFAEGVRVMQQQVNLDLGDGVAAVLRHGLFYDMNDETPMRYLVDTDVYREAFAAFALADVRPLLERMHESSTALFQYVITPAFYEELQQS